MRLITNTPDLLVLRHRPWALPLISGFLALLFAAGLVVSLVIWEPHRFLPLAAGCLLSLAGLWLTSRGARLTADARTGQLEVTGTSLTGRRREVFALDEVARAEVRGRPFGQDRREVSSLSLLVETGGDQSWHSLPTGSGTGRAEREAGYINAWLKSHRARQKLKG